ncbi:MAG: 16S rRNA (guanine(527)-N(7))-methyltransferase RsmG [Desulfobacterales bacterium]|nr:16S rRNA (guanine(527)-N(7))-methyltransferase RsmG [Desulfobacterales bacterium]
MDNGISYKDRLQQMLSSGNRGGDTEANDEKVELLEQLTKELMAANQTVNLTAISDPEEIADKLIFDSIFPGQFMPRASTVLDLGTGAGFPGIPLKIVYPDLAVTLIDGRRKKINYLKYVIRQLKLKGIEARHIRAEDMIGQGEGFDVVITRAVSSLEDLIRLALPLLKKNGRLIAMKGDSYQAEIDELKNDRWIQTGGKKYDTRGFKIDVKRYRLPVSAAGRALIMVRP